jgi:hypothetical protein
VQIGHIFFLKIKIICKKYSSPFTPNFKFLIPSVFGVENPHAQNENPFA